VEPIPTNETALLPSVEEAALVHLHDRGQIQSSAQACITTIANPVAGPAEAQNLAFVEGLWQVESHRDTALIDGNSGFAHTYGIASIQPVNNGYGFAEYFMTGWNNVAYFETTFWGSAGFGNRWAVLETSNASNKIASLSGSYRADPGFFRVEGELYGYEDARLQINPIDADHFTWEMSAAGDGDERQVLWSRSYTRITAEQQPSALQQALGGVQLHDPHDEMEPLTFWVGEWDWYEHHIDLGRDCAEGQASVTWTNNMQAIEERVISAYSPAEAGVDTYADYSLAIWNYDTNEFNVAWWTNGFIDARLYQGVCTGSGDDKVCELRASFMPSADENSIEWEVAGTRIDWVRK
jgi:hypothetical protein